MDSNQSVGVIYAKSLSDLVRFLNGTPHVTGVRVEMGLRFWGSPSYTMYGTPDPDLNEDREDLLDAINDHPSLEVLVFRGPSKATYKDLAVLLKGSYTHNSFRSLMIPMIPLEWYSNPVEKSLQLRDITSLIRNSKSMMNIHITNGTNNPGDYPTAFGSHVESKKTVIFQKAIDSLLLMKRLRKNKECRSSHI